MNVSVPKRYPRCAGIGVLVATALTMGGTAAEKAAGPLRVHPTNPRYFTDGTGKVVYLTGSHTWNSLQDGGFFTVEAVDPPPRFDFEAYLHLLQRYGHNFIRLWTWRAVKGALTVEWMHPVEGKLTPGEATAGGAKRQFNAPFAGDSPLYLATRKQDP